MALDSFSVKGVSLAQLSKLSTLCLKDKTAFCTRWCVPPNDLLDIGVIEIKMFRSRKLMNAWLESQVITDRKWGWQDDKDYIFYHNYYTAKQKRTEKANATV